MKAFISAVECSFPEKVLTNNQLESEFTNWSSEKIENKTGIVQRHIADFDKCSSDYGVLAAKKLFSKKKIDLDSIDFLLFCTQSPDYFLPTTACIVQDRLGLNTSCGAFDFNLGCSGFIYGLGTAKGLIETNQAKNILLITAETYSKFIHSGDKSVRTIFGDAATATLIQGIEKESDLIGPFVYGTDGSGYKNLIVPIGGMRNPKNLDTADITEDENGNIRTNEHLYMNGSEIFSFTLRMVPKALNYLMTKASLSMNDIDLFIFHQASKMILEHLKKKINIPDEKFYTEYKYYGNTVSSTIPLVIKKALDEGCIKSGDKLVLVGFGVGYSWAATLIIWH